MRGSTWRERVMRTRTRITQIFDNWGNCMLFIKSFWQIVKEWPADCQRLKKKHTLFHELSKIDLPIVKDWRKLQIVKDWPADCQRLPDSHSRSRNSFSSFNPRLDYVQKITHLTCNFFIIFPDSKFPNFLAISKNLTHFFPVWVLDRVRTLRFII